MPSVGVYLSFSLMGFLRLIRDLLHGSALVCVHVIASSYGFLFIYVFQALLLRLDAGAVVNWSSPE
jgi:hypothetical protein